MYKLFLCLRYLRRRYIALVAITGMALCVFMVLVVVSVFNGFLDAVENAARGMMGDVIVESPYGGLPRYEHLMEELRTLPEATAETPVIYAYGLLRVGPTFTHFVRVVGLRLPEATRVSSFGEGLWPPELKQHPRFEPSPEMLAGLRERRERQQALVDSEIAEATNRLAQFQALPPSTQRAEQIAAAEQRLDELKRLRKSMPVFLDYDPNLPRIIFGVDIPGTTERDSLTGAYTRKMPVGRQVRLTLLPIARGLSVLTQPVDKNFTYIGDDRLGIYGIDNLHVYIEFDVLQKLVDMNAKEAADGGEGEPALCSQVQVKLAPAYLGLVAAPATDGSSAAGLLVRQVVKDSPADKAGLREGDRVLAADGHPLHAIEDLRRVLTGGREPTATSSAASQPASGQNPPPLPAKHAGSELRLTILRDGAQQTLNVRLADQREALEAVKAAYALFQANFPDAPAADEASIQTWEQKQESFVGPIEKQRTLTVIMFSIISMVAVVLVFAIFYMMVVQRTRDVGVIKSIGGTSAGVAGIYLLYGCAIGLVGSAAGAIGGCVFVHYINQVHDWVGRTFHYVVFNKEAYLFDTIPNQVQPVVVAWVIIGAILAGLLGAILPALRAARMQPVEALRYE